MVSPCTRQAGNGKGGTLTSLLEEATGGTTTMQTVIYGGACDFDVKNAPSLVRHETPRHQITSRVHGADQ